MSQRERLLNRKRPFDTYALRIDDDTEARKKLEEARTILRLLALQGESADESAGRMAREALAEAEAEVAACYEQIVLRALPPEDYEALLTEHKPREDTDDEAWNVDTFPEACLLACVESDLTEAELQDVVKASVSDGERNGLYTMAIKVNVRVPDSTLPKGWTQTRS